MHRDPLPVAIGFGAGLRRRLQIELQVIGDEQIEKAVAVVIDESAPGAPLWFAGKQTSLFGDIGEGAVAIIAVEDVFPPVGDEEVIETVVVVVADRYCGCPSAAQQSRLFGDIDEGSVPLVLI